ncbi:MAG: hypothetical protein COT38_02400 [Candidatus Omnitrophica bacterium CG08_land_8_20_14_0_20_41_16]|uniref:ArnT-like N-terminal domain-containing protein n=1 Tax=Candidatus Sherwoodlollariibacterium unditelluris TaxID=1974757 RepID=A0A2G9YJW6_9BACT|nr:MAG: hypothetical protein COX41_02540 [Candidatus Omnitrophica bacterium CG23_combo_of_CG06-09_8_20_14_all_41_10]PIS33999.1 MAG: hypothetical protein COT38_02400 [Candidatus Omnitrophica bacterium CG08_land_8_20_14_0_20_41_16]
MSINNNLKAILVLFMLSFVFLMLGNNILSLTNPDEVFYAGTAKEMVQQKTWLVPYLFGKPQFEKPILTYWLLRIGFILFGITSFSARFFPALFAIIGIIAVYLFSLAGFGEKKKAFLCALVLMSSGLYIGLARTVFTDMIFSVFILLSLTAFFLGYIVRSFKSQGIILFFVFSACAVLTKGPLGLLIPFITVIVFLVIRKQLKFLFCKYSLWGLLLFILIGIPWYIYMIKRFGNSFTQEFFYNGHIRRLFQAEHRKNDSWYFYPLYIVLCAFPWTIFAVSSFANIPRKLKDKASKPMYIFLLSWVLTTFIIFQIAHSKLVSYILPLFPALAIIIGDFIYEAGVYKKRLMSILSTASLAVFIALPFLFLIAALKYPMYISLSLGLYIFAVLFVIFVIAQVIILWRKPAISPYFLAFNIIIILFAVFISHSKFDGYVSSKGAVDYLKSHGKLSGVILCSKSFVRGVRFYTSQEVAVLNAGGGNFFSPHPIVYLNTDDKIFNFLAAQKEAYGILNKSSFENLSRISRNGFELNLLNKVGDEYIVFVRAKTINKK